MAQEKEDFSPCDSNNSDDDENITTNGTNSVKPDLGFENVNVAASGSDRDGNRSEKKSVNNIKKEESSFSFKHFLKRDLSLPTTSVNNYEATGAKPKIYSNSYHPSLGKLNIQAESSGSSSNRKESNNRNKDTKSNNSSSDSSIELHTNDYNDFSRRPLISNDTIGMPSLPDFVQDHLLVEQAYLGTDASLNVDLDNLPDFTFNSNSNYECANSPDWSRNGKVYESGGNGGQGPSPQLALDLTDCVDRHHQPSASNFSSFPLDLPQHAASSQPSGGETLRLPDFLPTNAGEGQGDSNEHRERIDDHNELETERRLRQTTQRELRISQQEAASLRHELATTRAALLRVQATNRESAARGVNTSPEEGAAGRTPEEDSLIASLKSEIGQLRLELRTTRQEVNDLRNARRSIARSLTLATNSAETSLRDLLSGLDQVRGLANSMDPP